MSDEDYYGERDEYQEELCAARRRQRGEGWMNPDEDEDEGEE